jgi:hypothetical protein
MKKYRIKEKINGTWAVQHKGFLGFWVNSMPDFYDPSSTDRTRQWTYYQCKDWIRRQHEIAAFKPKILYPPFPDSDPNYGHGV